MIVGELASPMPFESWNPPGPPAPDPHLGQEYHTTGELAAALQLTAPEVSRHLAVLRKSGLLVTERRGRYVYYSLDASVLTALGTDLLAAVLR